MDGATLDWESHRRFADLPEEEIKQMPLPSYEEYEKKRMEKNTWHVCRQVAERIDDVPVLKERINSRVSELPGKLYFFNSVHLDNYRAASARNKTQVPGEAYFRKVESFIEDHYVGGELLTEFCRDACKESGEGSDVLGILTTDGWDQKQREFHNLCLTQTILDIPWMSIRRNRQAGHRMTIQQENV